MVTSTAETNLNKANDKLAKKTASSSKKVLRAPVSPTTCIDENGELEALRLRNKVLTEVLESIKETADEHVKKHLDLVWFARNRTRFPNHKERKRIEKQHSDELIKLHTKDGDYYHGLNSGCLAAARMFQKQADVLDINEHTQVTDDMLTKIGTLQEKIEAAKQEFPHIDVDCAM